jgi:hypothetical protein
MKEAAAEGAHGGFEIGTAAGENARPAQGGNVIEKTGSYRSGPSLPPLYRQ